jgi:hypothetical protein
MRFGSAIALLLVLVLLVPRLFDPQTWILVQAIESLGPTGGWRCARGATYVYDPSREQPDSALVQEAPETLVEQRIPEAQIDYVEVNLKQAEAAVWTSLTSGDNQERRVYVLTPGRQQAITIDEFGARLTICQAHLGDWNITAEHELG